MNKIKIITDSTSDLPADIIKQYGLEVLPLIISFGEESFRDGIDITLHPFLKRMKESPIFPSTSQVNPQRFVECYKQYLEDGYKIISIHLSSKMSGTYQSACIAKDLLETEDIVVIDSLNVTAGLGLLVIEACKLREKGLNIYEIEEKIKEIIPHIKSALIFDSLDNLVKGGRVSKAAGAISGILNIKAILEVKDGEINALDKARGTKKAIHAVLDYIESLGIQEETATMLLNTDTVEVIEVFRNNLKESNKKFIETEVGCVVGTHAGYGACGIFFIEKYQ